MTVKALGAQSGWELAYVENDGPNITATAVGQANRVDATALIFQIGPTRRPTRLHFHGSVFNPTINDGVGIAIVQNVAGNANNTPMLNNTQMVSAGIASAVIPINLWARVGALAAPTTFKVMLWAVVGGTATIGCAAVQPAIFEAISS